MIKLELEFSHSEAISLFRSADLVVAFRDMAFEIKGKCEVLKVWTVQNPHTREIELLDDAFRNYLKVSRANLFLTADKIKVYQTFKKKKQ